MRLYVPYVGIALAVAVGIALAPYVLDLLAAGACLVMVGVVLGLALRVWRWLIGHLRYEHELASRAPSPDPASST